VTSRSKPSSSADWWEVYFYFFVMICGLLAVTKAPMGPVAEDLLEALLVMGFYYGLWRWLLRHDDALSHEKDKGR
jgi:hypothetical protein